MRLLIAAGMTWEVPEEAFDLYIGVDRGALVLARSDHPLDIAVGDFDSMSAAEFAEVEEKAERLIKYPSEKDLTDTEAAFDLVLEEFPNAEITLIGSLGGRLDHLLTNVYLPTRPKYQALAQQITVIDGENVVEYYQPGKHILHNIYRKIYLGFVEVNTKNSLEIVGAKYPLKAGQGFSDIYASNEFIDDNPVTIQHSKGIVIVIYSSDKEK